MEEEPIINIEIDTDGTIKVDMECIKGTSCEDIVKKLLKQVGVIVQSQKKAEYYEENESKVRIVDEE